MANKKQPSLVQEIESAFSHVPYPGDNNIVYDISGHDLESVSIAEAFKGKHWKTLPSEFLRYHSSSLFFLSASGFRFYLPAYLLISILQFKVKDGFMIINDTIANLNPPQSAGVQMNYFLQKVHDFTPEQKLAVKHFLIFMQEAYYQEPFIGKSIRAALNHFWNN